MAKIAVDCDGVLARFDKGFLKLAHKIDPVKYPLGYEVTAWGQLNDSRVWEQIRKERNWWMTLQPYQAEVEALAKFLASTSKHDVWIVTARQATEGLTSAMQTSLWIDSLLLQSFGYLGVITCEANAKADLCEAMEFDYIVDDKASTIVMCQDVTNAALLTRPWNKSVKVEWRVDNLGSFFDTIKE